jgi:hypothetical protein
MVVVTSHMQRKRFQSTGRHPCAVNYYLPVNGRASELAGVLLLSRQPNAQRTNDDDVVIVIVLRELAVV